MKSILDIRRCVAFVMTGIALSACEDRRRHEPSEPVAIALAESPVAADAPPKEVARAMLNALSDAQRARAHGLGDPQKKKAYDLALSRIRALSAAKEIHEQVLAARSITIPRDVSESAAITIINEAWISEIAHYCDGILLDTLRLTPESPQSEATAYVEGQNPIEREKFAKMEADLRQASSKAAADSPSSGATRLAALKARALAEGFNAPPNAIIELRVRKRGDSWRVLRVSLAPGSSRARSSTTTLPTVGT